MLAPLAASLVQAVSSSVEDSVSARGIRRAASRYMDENSLYPLKNMQITNYFKYEPRFNDVFSRKKLCRIKDGVYVIYDKNTKETHSISLFLDRNLGLSFHSFGNEYIRLQVLSHIRDKLITHNMFRIKEKFTILSFKLKELII